MDAARYASPMFLNLAKFTIPLNRQSPRLISVIPPNNWIPPMRRHACITDSGSDMNSDGFFLRSVTVKNFEFIVDTAGYKNALFSIEFTAIDEQSSQYEPETHQSPKRPEFKKCFVLHISCTSVALHWRVSALYHSARNESIISKGVKKHTIGTYHL